MIVLDAARYICAAPLGDSRLELPLRSHVAVCLLPGTELAFEENVQVEAALGFGYKRLQHKLARFRQVDKDQPSVHHDALEFPDGQIVKLTKLRPDQHATVLQMPARPRQIIAGETEPLDVVIV
jgi:hypothetical protein